ncbi:MAG TPA: PepSY-associated TM helix domain-containing protein [Vicinamibacterales bacterium]
MPLFARTLEVWNRRLHYYLGLYFLLFLWLFSLTGLMLNHQQWFTDLYDRHEVSYDPSIETPAGETREEQTRSLMRQLKLRGEVEWPASQPAMHIDFNLTRPNGAAQVRVDLNAKQAYVKEFKNGKLHAFQIFHTFSGSRFNQPASRRDWILTSLWVFAMDALAVGLIVMVLGSYYMWWRLKKSRGLGTTVLAIGFVTCGAFVAGFL